MQGIKTTSTAWRSSEAKPHPQFLHIYPKVGSGILISSADPNGWLGSHKGRISNYPLASDFQCIPYLDEALVRVEP
jgi:hypothetical protein